MSSIHISIKMYIDTIYLHIILSNIFIENITSRSKSTLHYV